MEIVTDGTAKAVAATTESGETGAVAAVSATAVGDTGSATENTSSALATFLSVESNKAAYDAAVADAVAVALEQQAAEEKEKQRKAKLTADQRIAEKQQELADREAKLQAAELKNAAVVVFGEAKIPVKLAECLNYSSKEAYEKSLAAAKEAFQEAVETAVNDRLRGKGQLAADSGTAKALSGQQVSVSTDNDFAAILRENQAKR